jgi:hypothetical protein
LMASSSDPVMSASTVLKGFRIRRIGQSDDT